MIKPNKSLAAAFLLLGGCAGLERSCSTFNAEEFGADWIIAQYDTNGKPYNCWKLDDVSVKDEQGGGIHWLDQDGHLVHIGGWYNRVQVERKAFDQAARLVGVELSKCVNGKYTH
ncbi:hypothetical protein HYT24_01335 [Candidatus Pacearchaeota archaeon]|nr:hypothetical protein [Candidatus Pacearchaeota archaeon]